ncbi:MAG TPA: hypothetical protein VKX39_16975 [Bryobacteraceae bacterium]|jgi:hypothetical protein|nr:hypothetical protein [Bryobacteraceae bacterium]
MRATFWLLLVSTLQADELTQKMAARVSEEAEAFRKIAPEVLGTEKLHQSAIQPSRRFHPHGAKPSQPEWRDRDVVSEYAFASFSGQSGAIHEVRQVISVDGRKVSDSKNAQDALARAILASDDGQKRELLKQFEKVGLSGAVTDFGQLLLLFTRRDIERYEFTPRGARMIGYDRALVFSYQQIDGPEALTLFDEKKGERAHRLRMQGEIRVRAEDFLPLQITIAVGEGDAPNSVREEAAVTYAMSKYGALLPVSTEHYEIRNGKIVVQNNFTYSDFHKFSASSDIKFDAK